MSVLDRFLPPPGDPEAIRAAAASWRVVADGLQHLMDAVHARSSALTSSWHGSASDAFTVTGQGFMAEVGRAARLLHDNATLLEGWASRLEEAQTEYRRRLALVAGTAVVFGALTVVTFGGSDVVGAGAVGAELAIVTEELATGGAALAAGLAQLAAQAARLALQAAVFGGVTVAADAASALVTYRDVNALSHVDVRGDMEAGLIGAVAGPIRALMVGGGATTALARGAVGGLTESLVAGGLSLASADVLVRVALGEKVDPSELLAAAIPIGPRAKRLLVDEAAMIGSEGDAITSTTLTKGKDWRLDLENPNPGQRPGQMHLQDHRKGKWLYDFRTGRFIGAPKRLELELMRDKTFQRYLRQGLRFLKEDEG